MSFIQKILSNIYSVSIFKKFNVIIFGVFSTALLTRYLGAENRGEYAYILSIVNMLVVVFNLGINLSYPNFKRKLSKNYLPIFCSLSIAEFILLISLAILFFIISRSVNVFTILLLTAIGVFRLQLNYFNLVEDIRFHSFITIITSILNFILLLLIFVLTESNLFYVYVIYILKDIIIIIASLFSLNFKISIRYFDFSAWKEIIQFGLIPMYTTLLISINYKIDVVILQVLNIDFIAIGLYTVGVSLAEYGWMIPDIFKDIMTNKTARKDDIKNMSFSLRISSSIMLIVFIVLIIFGKYIIILLFGSEFLEAYSVTVIIFLGIYSMIYCKIIGTLYIAKGQWKFYAIILSCSVITNIIMNFIMIPKWGINGAAISSVFSYSIAGMAFLIDFKKSYNLKLLDLVFINKEDVKRMMSFFVRT